MKRPPGILALSEWELDEMLLLRRRGWTNYELAHFYGISTKSVERYCKRAGADSRREGVNGVSANA